MGWRLVCAPLVRLLRVLTNHVRVRVCRDWCVDTEGEKRQQRKRRNKKHQKFIWDVWMNRHKPKWYVQRQINGNERHEWSIKNHRFDDKVEIYKHDTAQPLLEKTNKIYSRKVQQIFSPVRNGSEVLITEAFCCWEKAEKRETNVLDVTPYLDIFQVFRTHTTTTYFSYSNR